MAILNDKNLRIEILGESHSKEIKCSVFGLKGISFNIDKLCDFLSRRRGGNIFATSRVESDLPIFNNVENGIIKDNFSFIIKNENISKTDYQNLYAKPRPSHADLSWYLKDGVVDFSGGGRFSGRLTLPICVVGGICKQYLESNGIFVEGYISRIGNIKGLSYKDKTIDYDYIIKNRENDIPTLSTKNDMLKLLEQAKIAGDSVGGIVECIVYNMKGGIGDNLFSGLEGKISSLVYSIPAVKGVEFGLGFDFASSFGSKVNDEISYSDKKEIELLSNNNGGILGGISNGAPITLRVAIKPTPSIAKEQKTIDLISKQNTTIKIEGRHDTCIALRAVPCIESAVAIAITNELLGAL